MPLPVTFGTLTGGNQNLSLFDTQFAAVAALGIIPCAASGQNAVALTPNTNTPTISSYTDLAPAFVFVAAQTSSGPVTINVAGLGARNAYKFNGATQVGSGDFVAGQMYKATPLQALNAGAGGFVVDVIPASTFTPALLRGYIGGLILSNDGGSPNSVLDISAGTCTDSTNTTTINLAAITKSTAGTWVAGSGNNGMGQGLTIANSTWYHVFAIINGGNADAYFDTSVSAANAPVGTTAFRRIGSFKTDASAHILAFVQLNDTFLWSASVNDSPSSPGTASRSTVTLAGVPTGLKVEALMRVTWNGTSNNQFLILTSLDESDQTPTTTLCSLNTQVNGTAVAAPFQIRTNASAQIGARSGTASLTLSIGTYGWIDTRGRFN